MLNTSTELGNAVGLAVTATIVGLGARIAPAILALAVVTVGLRPART